LPTLNWLGKDKVVNYAAKVPCHAFNHCYNFGGTSGNKIIHGDNLTALKSLLPLYAGRVKCIYIDPPYNTGNEGWIYNDNVNSPQIQKWLGQVVGREGEDLTRHDKWLCMMYPRLKLLKQLLSDDGAIFISIDDNEQANLKLICDEIFGAQNFVCNVCVKMSHLSGMKMSHKEKKIPKIKEFMLIYAHSYENFIFNPVYVPGDWDKVMDRYNGYIENFEDEDISRWRRVPLNKKIKGMTEGEAIKFKILNADKIFRTAVNDSFSDTPKDSTFRKMLSKKGLLKYVYNAEEVLFASSKLKSFDNELKPADTIGDIWTDIGINNLHNEGGVQFPNAKKPMKLIERVLQLATNKNSIVLDAFAGSGTTAHAVLNLNAADGGDRKFILIEMESYAESITAERVRRVGGSFDFYEVGEPLFVDGDINPAVSLEQIRAYVWATETATEYVKPECDDCEEFLGVDKGTAYYFYTGVLDSDFLGTMRTRADSYVIFAESNAVGEEFLQKYKIEFKKIPRDIVKIWSEDV